MKTRWCCKNAHERERKEASKETQYNFSHKLVYILIFNIDIWTHKIILQTARVRAYFSVYRHYYSIQCYMNIAILSFELIAK